MSADLYDTRSYDDNMEPLCSLPDHPPAPKDPRHTLHEVAERVLGNEYTRNLSVSLSDNI